MTKEQIVALFEEFDEESEGEYSLEHWTHGVRVWVDGADGSLKPADLLRVGAQLVSLAQIAQQLNGPYMTAPCCLN